MAVLLLLGYVILFAVMVGMMVHNVRRRRKWLPLWLFELCAAIGARAMMMIADAAPGTGMMPGLRNFGLVIYSLGAAAAFAVLLIVSLIIGLSQRNK